MELRASAGRPWGLVCPFHLLDAVSAVTVSSTRCSTAFVIYWCVLCSYNCINYALKRGYFVLPNVGSMWEEITFQKLKQINLFLFCLRFWNVNQSAVHLRRSNYAGPKRKKPWTYKEGIMLYSPPQWNNKNADAIVMATINKYISS